MARRASHAGRARGGFTLLEVLVALVVVATAFVGLLGLHNRNLNVLSRDRDLTVATLAAREMITNFELVEGFPELGAEGGQLEYQKGFRWEREVTEIPDLPDVRRVVLRIIWDEARPRACEITYYARNRNAELFPQ